MEGNVTGLSYTLIWNGKLDEGLGDCGLPEDFSRNGLPTSSATKSSEPSSGEYASLRSGRGRSMDSIAYKCAADDRKDQGEGSTQIANQVRSERIAEHISAGATIGHRVLRE